MDNFQFLKAERFWIMIIGAVFVYLETKGFVGEAERNLVATITAGFIAVRTVDRFGERI